LNFLTTNAFIPWQHLDWNPGNMIGQI